MKKVNGIKEITGVLYRISDQSSGRHMVIECNNESDLMKYVADLVAKGVVISNVVRLEVHFNNISCTRLAVRSNPIFKARLKENLNKSNKNVVLC